MKEGRQGERKREGGNKSLLWSSILREEVVKWPQGQRQRVNLREPRSSPFGSETDCAPPPDPRGQTSHCGLRLCLPAVSGRLSPLTPGSLPVIPQDCTPSYKACFPYHRMSPGGRQGSFHRQNHSQVLLAPSRGTKTLTHLLRR